MSNETKTNGGTAFPSLRYEEQEGYESHEKASFDGATLRDYFAGKADISVYNLVESLANVGNFKPTLSEVAEAVATMRFIEADAMLAEREKGEEDED